MKNFTKIVNPVRVKYGELYVKITYKDGKLSLTGVEGATSNGNCRGGAGQIVMSDWDVTDYKKGWSANEVAKLRKYWELYHLNDMSPMCEHQKAQGWGDIAKEEVITYHWSIKMRYWEKQKELKNEAVERACSTKSKALGFSPEEKRIMQLEPSIKTSESALTGWDLKYYEANTESDFRTHKEVKTKGWVNFEENKNGILSKPCPVCGYKYGTAWKTHPVPEKVLKWLNDLPEATSKPAWI